MVDHDVVDDVPPVLKACVIQLQLVAQRPSVRGIEPVQPGE